MPPSPQVSAIRPSTLAGVALCIALGIVLRWPAMDAGFRSDDYVQMAAVQGEFPAPRTAWDLFRFDGATAEDAQALIDDGYHPWWTSPRLRLSMWRPLSSLLMAGDHALLGPSPFLHHLHSLLWWVALCVVAAWVFHMLLPGRVAMLATLVFAIDEAHSIPLAWLANRSTLVACAFGFLALGLHIRWHRSGGGRVRWGSVAATVLSLAAGEYALSALVYLWAFSALDATRPVSSRVRAAAPTFLCACAYLGLRTATGHGVSSSGFYIGPASDPLRFAAAALDRLPVLWGDALLGMPSAYWTQGAPLRAEMLSLLGVERFRALPDWHSFQVTFGVLSVLVGYAAVRAVARAAPAQRDGHALWALALGALLSVIPAGGSLPNDRLLIGMALGVSAVVGLFAGGLIERVRSGPRMAPALVLSLIAFVHVGLATTRTRASSHGFARTSGALRDWSLAAAIPPQPIAAQTDIYIVSAGDFTTAANLPWVRDGHGASRPRSYRRLSGASHAHDLHRTGDRTLEITVLSSNLGSTFRGSLYRGSDEPIGPGTRFALRGLDVEVLASIDGNPYRMRFVFDRSLDDPTLLLLQARRDGLVPLSPPAVGEHVLSIRPQTVRR